MLLNMVAFAGDMLILWNFAGIFRSSKLANREVLPIKNRPKGHSSDGILLTLLLLWASSTWGRKPTAREDAARSWLLISAHATIMIHVSLRPNMDLICKHSHCYQKPSFHHVHHDHCDHNHDDHKSYLSLSYNHMPLWWSVISIMISTGSFLREFAWIKSATLVFSQKSEPPCLNSRNQTVLNFLGGNSSQRLSPKWSPQSLTSDLDSHTDHCLHQLDLECWNFCRNSRTQEKKAFLNLKSWKKTSELLFPHEAETLPCAQKISWLVVSTTKRQRWQRLIQGVLGHRTFIPWPLVFIILGRSLCFCPGNSASGFWISAKNRWVVTVFWYQLSKRVCWGLSFNLFGMVFPSKIIRGARRLTHATVWEYALWNNPPKSTSKWNVTPWTDGRANVDKLWCTS